MRKYQLYHIPRNSNVNASLYVQILVYITDIKTFQQYTKPKVYSYFVFRVLVKAKSKYISSYGRLPPLRFQQSFGYIVAVIF